MSEAVLANALLPFYSTKRSGTGLGLALAREIAEAHGGRIALANREGGGLAVALILPRRLARTPHPRAADAMIGDGGSAMGNSSIQIPGYEILRPLGRGRHVDRLSGAATLAGPQSRHQGHAPRRR